MPLSSRRRPPRRRAPLALAPLTLAVLLVATSAPPLAAGAGVWTGGGPEGATLGGSVWDPTDADRVFISPIGGGLWRSDDGGLTWSPGGSGVVPPDRTVDELVVSGDGTLYAASEPEPLALYRSDDGGATWQDLSGPLAGESSISALAVDPADADVLYLAPGLSEPALLKSTDGGASWQASDTGLEISIVYSLAIDPGSPGVVYAGTSCCSKLWVSADGGATWTASDDGLESTAWTLATDPTDASNVLAGTFSGVYRSVDGATTWALDLAGRATAVAVDATGTAWAGVDEAIWRSDDGGASWVEIDAGLPTGEVEAFASSGDGQRHLAAANNGPFRRDAAGAWSRETAGLSRFPALSVPAVADAPERLWASSASSDWLGWFLRGLRRSDDGGATWSDLDSTLKLTDLELAPGSADRLWASSLDEVWESVDGGASFSPRLEDGGQFGGLGAAIQALAPHPDEPSTLFALDDAQLPAAGEPSILRSTDGGANWQPLWEPNPERWWYVLGFDLIAGPAGSDHLYALTYSSEIGESLPDVWAHSSADAGATWSHVRLAEDSFYPGGVAVDGADPAVAWAAVPSFSDPDDRLLRTADGGLTWQEVAGGPPCARSVATDPEEADTAWVGGCDGVWATTDGGATWEIAGEGFPDDILGVQALTVSSTRPRELRAGTWGGVWSLTTPLRLAAAATCPDGGELTVEIRNATAGGDVVLLHAADAGSTELPAGPCAGTEVDLAQPGLLTRLTADADGAAAISADAPAGACGRLLQALDLGACTVSPVVPVE